MGDIRMTRDFFLWCMSVIYLCAFTSLFVQIPGLYGDNGVLPAKLVVKKEAESFEELASEQPSLLRLLPWIGLDVAHGMDLVCLAGVIFSFVGVVSRYQRNCVTFAALWVFYLSLFQIGNLSAMGHKVGQTFLWFQWDILLLETGFLAIFVAPFNFFGWRSYWYHQWDKITMWLIKWLLFRLMFASGIVKLTSNCPTWWGLTALNYHFETQCIPTPAAWQFHQLPEWFLKMGVVFTYVVEIAVPFMYFSPVRSQRLFAFYAQVLLQLIIAFTGNYNFFNLITVVMCLSLVDDNFIRHIMRKSSVDSDSEPEGYPVPRKMWTPVKWALNTVVYGALIYWTVKLFTLRVQVHPTFAITSEIAFSRADLDQFLEVIVPVSIWMGVLSLAWEIAKGLKRSLSEWTYDMRMRNVAGCIGLGLVAFTMFGISLVPHSRVDGNATRSLPTLLRTLHSSSTTYKLSSSYGLFRRMTGVGGRPEVVIEGSNFMDKGWKEYDFRYKPGNVTYKPTLVAPHQPRLDWQMWFAALGSYHHNPWFLNLVYRLLNNQPEVIQLIQKNPFPDKPPKYIRAILYHYHFTTGDMKHEKYSYTDWWVRKRVKEYFPIVTKDEPSFVNYLRQAKIIEQPGEEKADPTQYNPIAIVLDVFRMIVGQPEGWATILALVAAGLGLTFLDPTLRLFDVEGMSS